MTAPDFPRITLVTPVYNGADLLARNVDSVAAAKDPNLEHILVDNRSTDRSWELMNELAKRHAHLRVTRQEETQGAAASINHGFALATGDIFAWLGHDDMWFPETPGRVREQWRAHPGITFLAGTVRILQSDGRLDLDRKPLAGLDFLDLFISAHIVNQEGCFWSREIHRPLDPGIRGAFDYDLWLRLFSGGNFQAHHTDELLACFQKRAGQLSGNLESYTDEMNLCRALHCSRVLGRPKEEFMRFQEQLRGMLQVPAFRAPCEKRIARDGVFFAPRLNRELCLAGIFFFLGRPGEEVVFHIHDMTARSIGLLDDNRTRAVAKIRTKQARLSVVVPPSGLVGVDLTSRGVDDPNASWIKCSHISCGDRIVTRAPKAPAVPADAPALRLEYPSLG
jgi:teichuronic acid biosynthesis glycosyltransferase TuaG